MVHANHRRMRWLRALLARGGPIAALLALVTAPLLAGTTGKLTGRVYDQEDRPIISAGVAIVGTTMGALTNNDGVFNVINIAPGTYEVKVSGINYEGVLESIVYQNIIISADNSTRLDVELAGTAIPVEEIIVEAKELPIDIDVTDSRATLRSEQIEALPVQELEDVVNLQAGVVDGHFRGGRIGEVQYQVDGVSVNNPYDNRSTLRIDRSLLQEVQVISGTFDAEYGQAMSGVVNAVLKDGTTDWRWNTEVFGGGYLFDEEGRLTTMHADANTVNLQGSVSGPIPLPKTVFLLNLRRYSFDDYVYGVRLFRPTDKNDLENKIFYPTGDLEEVPLQYSREFSGLGKISTTFRDNMKLSYQAIFNDIDGRRDNYAYVLNPDGLTEQHTFSITHGFDWRRTLGVASAVDVSLRQNYFKYTDRAYEDVYDPRYDAAGPPVSEDIFFDAIVQGVDSNRFLQRTNTWLAKGNYASQVHPEHLIKLGGELQMPRISFGTDGYLTYTLVNGEYTLVRHIDEPPDYPGINEYRPVIASGFLQDQIEWPDLTLRAGLRLDVFDARTYVPGDLANPANAIQGAPAPPPVPTTTKTSAAPRLGVAYPIHERAAVHFSYGHFYQYPPLSDIFNNADYSVLRSLQAGGIDYGTLGNPDIRPEKTVQYEIGYKQAVTDDFGVDITTFYKDIRDLLGVEFVTTYNNAEYARLTNIDFGSVVGITVALDHRRLGPVRMTFDYTWQQATGNSSDPRETSTRAEAGEDPRPRLVPFNWDQRHTLNLTGWWGRPRDYAVSGVLRIGSGQPYTPVIESGFGGGLETNSGRKPAGVVVDLRGEKYLPGVMSNFSLFGRVFNLFDTRYFNGDVFSSTGSPYYSRFPEADQNTLFNPTRYYEPRRIEFGIRLGSEGM